MLADVFAKLTTILPKQPTSFSLLKNRMFLDATSLLSKYSSSLGAPAAFYYMMYLDQCFSTQMLASNIFPDVG
jgi:hypothetical protein